MPTNYSGQTAAAQTPSPAPAPGNIPIIQIPLGTEAPTIESITQALKVPTDFATWLMKAAAGQLSFKSLVIDAPGNTPSAGTAGTLTVPSIGSSSGTTAITNGVLASGSVIGEAAVSKSAWIAAGGMLPFVVGTGIGGWMLVNVGTAWSSLGATNVLSVPIVLPTVAIGTPASSGTAPTLTSVSVRCSANSASPNGITLTVYKYTNMVTTPSGAPVGNTSVGSASTTASGMQLLTVSGLNLQLTQDTLACAVISSGAANDVVYGVELTYSSVVF